MQVVYLRTGVANIYIHACVLLPIRLGLQNIRTASFQMANIHPTSVPDITLSKLIVSFQ